MGRDVGRPRFGRLSHTTARPRSARPSGCVYSGLAPRRAAPRLVPPPPAVRVRARRCGFFSGLRGAPLLAPVLAGARLFRGLPDCQAPAGCEDTVGRVSGE